MGSLAPIALFTHSRLDHLRRTTEALALNPEAMDSELLVFSDGPRSELEAQSVQQVREHLYSLSGFRSVRIHESEENLGLSRSIIRGINNTLEKHDSVIVVEDDIVTSRHFLRFMNEGLQKFRDNERVASVHGYVYPTRRALPEAFFLRGGDCWGWATWRNAWARFRHDSRELLEDLRDQGLVDLFDFSGSFGFSKMLEKEGDGRVDSWAIRWHASLFLDNKLTLYPGKSLVENIGNDGTGTHPNKAKVFEANLAINPISFSQIEVEESSEARRAFEEFFKSNRLMSRILRRIRAKTPTTDV